MKTQPKTCSKERQYIRLGDPSEVERLSFPDEYFEDDDDDYVFLQEGKDDEPVNDKVARKAEKEPRDGRILGEICFVSGVIVFGAVTIGVITIIARLFMFPVAKKIAKTLDW